MVVKVAVVAVHVEALRHLQGVDLIAVMGSSREKSRQKALQLGGFCPGLENRIQRGALPTQSPVSHDGGGVTDCEPRPDQSAGASSTGRKAPVDAPR